MPQAAWRTITMKQQQYAEQLAATLYAEWVKCAERRQRGRENKLTSDPLPHFYFYLTAKGIFSLTISVTFFFRFCKSTGRMHHMLVVVRRVA